VTPHYRTVLSGVSSWVRAENTYSESHRERLLEPWDSRQPVATWTEEDIAGIGNQEKASEDVEDLMGSQVREVAIVP
jgi:hypothetical protein